MHLFWSFTIFFINHTHKSHPNTTTFNVTVSTIIVAFVASVAEVVVSLQDSSEQKISRIQYSKVRFGGSEEELFGVRYGYCRDERGLIK